MHLDYVWLVARSLHYKVFWLSAELDIVNFYLDFMGLYYGLI